jgi:hypothetical protein
VNVNSGGTPHGNTIGFGNHYPVGVVGFVNTSEVPTVGVVFLGRVSKEVAVTEANEVLAKYFATVPAPAWWVNGDNAFVVYPAGWWVPVIGNDSRGVLFYTRSTADVGGVFCTVVSCV